MFTRLGRFVVRRRRAILVLTGLFVVVAAVVGTQVFERLGRRGFDDPGSESSRARTLLEDELGAGDPDLVLLADAGARGVDDSATMAAGTDLTNALAAEDAVGSAASYWTLGQAPPLRRADGTAALVLVDLTGTDEEVADAAATLTDGYAGRRGPLDVGVGGREAVATAITDQVESDLARAEAIAVPATLVLLVLVFGGLLAAALPLVVALVALIGTFLARGGAHDGDRRQDRGVLGTHRRRVAGGTARLPPLLPAVVRVKRGADRSRLSSSASPASRRGRSSRSSDAVFPGSRAVGVVLGRQIATRGLHEPAFPLGF